MPGAPTRPEGDATFAVNMHDLRVYLNIYSMGTLPMFSKRIHTRLPTTLLDHFVMTSMTPAIHKQNKAL